MRWWYKCTSSEAQSASQCDWNDTSPRWALSVAHLFEVWTLTIIFIASIGNICRCDRTTWCSKLPLAITNRKWNTKLSIIVWVWDDFNELSMHCLFALMSVSCAESNISKNSFHISLGRRCFHASQMPQIISAFLPRSVRRIGAICMHEQNELEGKHKSSRSQLCFALCVIVKCEHKLGSFVALCSRGAVVVDALQHFHWWCAVGRWRWHVEHRQCATIMPIYRLNYRRLTQRRKASDRNKRSEMIVRTRVGGWIELNKIPWHSMWTLS